MSDQPFHSPTPAISRNTCALVSFHSNLDMVISASLTINCASLKVTWCAVLKQEGTVIITRPLLLYLASELSQVSVEVQRPVAE
jgi:hypothetical protein